MIVISSEIVQVISACDSYDLISLEKPGSISKRRSLKSMYVTLWVDIVQTVLIIDEFETIIVVDLTVEETSGSTLLVGGVQTLLTIDGLVIWLVEYWISKILVDQQS